MALMKGFKSHAAVVWLLYTGCTCIDLATRVQLAPCVAFAALLCVVIMSPESVRVPSLAAFEMSESSSDVRVVPLLDLYFCACFLLQRGREGGMLEKGR